MELGAVRGNKELHHIAATPHALIAMKFYLLALPLVLYGFLSY
jgi:hypothetical protein